MSRLEDILEWNMTEDQAKAFKLSLLWENLCRQEFPEMPVTKLKLVGDPRKSILFRHCFKLVRDTKGIIQDEEYQLYILAQLHVLKQFMRNKAVRIDPVILTGPKAWRRWRLWKRRYDRAMGVRQNVDEVGVVAPLHSIKRELEESKTYLKKALGTKPTAARIAGAINDQSLVRWVNYETVSPYYVILSPWVRAALKGQDYDDVFMFDTEVYMRSVTPAVRKCFAEVFPDED